MPTVLRGSDGLPDLERITQDVWAGHMIELVAGMPEEDEPWIETVRRETTEEMGFDVTPSSIRHVCSFYPSPGACSEQIHLYYAHLEGDNRMASDRIGEQGRGDEDEDTRRIVMTPADFLAQVEAQKIKDAKCLAAAEYIRRPSNWARFGLSLESFGLSLDE